MDGELPAAGTQTSPDGDRGSPQATGARAVRYPAFISYSHRDEAAARALHRRLERYRPPRAVLKQRGSEGRVRHPIRPVFRDSDELAAGGDLTKAIIDALDDSENLIVVCSPASARSHWVALEIEHFRTHSTGNVLPYLVAGVPNHGGEQECLPSALRGDGATATGTQQPLAADARRRSRRSEADLRLIAGILGLSFDDLRRRQLRRRRFVVTTSVGVVAVLLVVLAVLSAWALANASRARSAQRDALEQRDVANAQTELAEQQRDIADQQTQVAEEQREIADTERASAEQAAERLRVRSLGAAALLASGAGEDLPVLLAVESAKRGLAAGTPVTEALAALRIDVPLLPQSPESNWTITGSGPSLLARVEPTQAGLLVATSGDRGGRVVDIPDDVVRHEWSSPETTTIALSSDGRLLARLNSDGELTLVDLDEDRILEQLDLEPSWTGPDAFGVLRPMAFSPENSTLLIATDAPDLGDPPEGELSQAEFARRYGDRVSVYSLPDLVQIEQVVIPDGSVRSLALSPDGRYLVAGTGTVGASGVHGGAAYLFDRLTDSAPLQLTSGFVSAVEFSPDVTSLALTTLQGGLTVFSLPTARPVSTVDATATSPALLAYSDDGQRLALADARYEEGVLYTSLALVDASSGQVLARARVDGDPMALSFRDSSSTDVIIVTAPSCLDESCGTATVWAVGDMVSPDSSTLEMDTSVTSLGLAGDGSTIAAGAIDGSVSTWSMAGMVSLGRHRRIGPAHSVGVSPGAQAVVAIGGNTVGSQSSGTAWLDGDSVEFGGELGLAVLAVSDDGRLFVTADGVRDTATGDYLETNDRLAAATPDLLLVHRADAEITRAESEEPPVELDVGGEVYLAEFDPTGEMLAVINSSHELSVFDAVSGDRIADLDDARWLDVQWSQRWLVATGNPHDDTDEPTSDYQEGLQEWRVDVLDTGDGSRTTTSVASRCGMPELEIYRCPRGLAVDEELLLLWAGQSLQVHDRTMPGPVVADLGTALTVETTADARWAIVGRSDGTITFIDWSPNRLIRRACRLVQRDFTAEEWREFVVDEGDPGQACSDDPGG